ncbi:hypothetical protein [Rhodobacteraceae bacterium DSL-40]|uniref:hypothetical protein n=1 Tax=Amaricoccus sp. B4 TaxID=3368557 RepID=UPI000DAC1E98
MIGLDVPASLVSGKFAKVAVLCGALRYASAEVLGRRFARLSVASAVTAAGQVTAILLSMLFSASDLNGSTQQA